MAGSTSRYTIKKKAVHSDGPDTMSWHSRAQNCNSIHTSPGCSRSACLRFLLFYDPVSSTPLCTREPTFITVSCRSQTHILMHIICTMMLGQLWTVLCASPLRAAAMRPVSETGDLGGYALFFGDNWPKWVVLLAGRINVLVCNLQHDKSLGMQIMLEGKQILARTKPIMVQQHFAILEHVETII